MVIIPKDWGLKNQQNEINKSAWPQQPSSMLHFSPQTSSWLSNLPSPKPLPFSLPSTVYVINTWFPSPPTSSAAEGNNCHYATMTFFHVWNLNSIFASLNTYSSTIVISLALGFSIAKVFICLNVLQTYGTDVCWLSMYIAVLPWRWSFWCFDLVGGSLNKLSAGFWPLLEFLSTWYEKWDQWRI